jgi:hypothetical protein
VVVIFVKVQIFALNGFLGNFCENNCNTLYYYIDLSNTLNKSLSDICTLNVNFIIINVNFKKF